jgi:hypothetical protein
MAGMQLLAQTARVSRLDAAMSAALAPWRKARAVHDPGKIIVDVAMALAAGGDCPADVAVVRAGSALFGPVASDPTISRLVDLLAADGDAALAAIRGRMPGPAPGCVSWHRFASTTPARLWWSSTWTRRC